MYLSAEIPKYEFVHGSNSFLFDSVEYECGTQVSQYTVMTNGLDSAVNGKIPPKITLKGRFLKSDFDGIKSYINENSGNIIESFTIDGKEYNSMVLLKGNAVLESSSLIGKTTLIFWEADN